MARLKHCRMLALVGMLVISSISAWPDDPSSIRAQTAVRGLYRQIVKRHPLGIPIGTDRTAIWPFLTKDLRRLLETAQNCERSYFKQHPDRNEKPSFPWLEEGLFSGGNEQALPSLAEVKRTELQPDGSIRVYVELSYKETARIYAWKWTVVAIVKHDQSHYVIDDIVQFEESPHKELRLSQAFAQCRGPRWVGYEELHSSFKCTPETFGIYDAPPTARELRCFQSFHHSSTMRDVIQTCGIPDEDVGSGLSIFVYHLTDGSTVAVGTPGIDQPRLRITHSSGRGNATVLLE